MSGGARNQCRHQKGIRAAPEKGEADRRQCRVCPQSPQGLGKGIQLIEIQGMGREVTTKYTVSFVDRATARSEIIGRRRKPW